MESTPDYTKGTFQYQGKTYHAHIERGEARIELGDLEENERKEILDNAIAVFKKNIGQQTEVERAVFTTYNTHLGLEYFGKEKSTKQLSLTESPEAAKVDSYVRSLALRYDSTPSGAFEGVGLERKAGEQTCYANTLLQMQFHLLGAKDLGPYKKEKGPVVPDVEKGREALWTAMRDLQQEMQKAKEAKKSIGKDSVMKVLKAATELGKAVGKNDTTWNDPKAQNDLMELWTFINEELPGLKAPHLDKDHPLYEDFYSGYAISLQPEDTSSLQTLAQKKVTDAKLDTLPETLPFLVNRFDSEGEKEFKGVEIGSTIQLTSDKEKIEYELITAAEHVGHSSYKDKKVLNSGHYIAYTRTEKENFMQRNDAKVTQISGEQATKRLATTGVLFFYRKKK